MVIKFYVSVDGSGNIIDSMAGPTMMAPPEYDYYFELDSWNVVDNLDNYIVENGELMKRS